MITTGVVLVVVVITLFKVVANEISSTIFIREIFVIVDVHTIKL